VVALIGVVSFIQPIGGTILAVESKRQPTNDVVTEIPDVLGVGVMC
jgi:hypothetical protein